MMRKLLGIVGILATVTACSSSDDAPESACVIEGTYANTATIDPPSEVGCTDLPVSAKNTITVTRNADASYAVALTGLPGECTATATEACKLQTKCDLIVANPTTAATTGTYQAVLTFTAAGLSGSAAISLPPNTAYPKGCSYNGIASATRL